MRTDTLEIRRVIKGCSDKQLSETKRQENGQRRILRGSIV
jgi:hypothetical protein